ncbi:MAG: magnesium/cobalt transporter CorA [Planctomycetia bacterium]|nr:magnesium/cobalt transporter CorA [Planctomycetia bacterium]
MSHKHHRRHRIHRGALPPGAPPGTLSVHPGARPSRVRVMAYGPDGLTERAVADLKEIAALAEKSPVVWVDVDGLGDLEVVCRLGEIFHLHPLALEDVLNVHQRPKVDQYGQHLFLVARMPSWNHGLETEQLSIFLGRNFVITLQDALPGDCLEPVRQRIRNGTGRVRQLGPDYLVYSILDAVTDSHFPILEQLGEELETIEDAILATPDPSHVSRLHGLKRDLLAIRRVCWPFRDALQTLLRDRQAEGDLIREETRVYVRDCYDHATRIIEWIENYRELSADLMNLYLTRLNNHMNEVMKVLTVFATIFTPLMFIASVYGMNFSSDVSPWNMPELRWYFGYPISLALMLVVAVALLYFVYKRGWLAPFNPAGVMSQSTGVPPPAATHVDADTTVVDRQD